MDHDARVRKAVTFAIFTCCQKERSHGCCNADAICVNRRGNILANPRVLKSNSKDMTNGNNIYLHLNGICEPNILTGSGDRCKLTVS